MENVNLMNTAALTLSATYSSILYAAWSLSTTGADPSLTIGEYWPEEDEKYKMK